MAGWLELERYWVVSMNLLPAASSYSFELYEPHTKVMNGVTGSTTIHNHIQKDLLERA